MPSKVISEYYRIGIMAREFDIPRQTIQSAVKRGELPHAELGCGLPVVRKSDVQAWMEEHAGREAGRPFSHPTPSTATADEKRRKALMEIALKKKAEREGQNAKSGGKRSSKKGPK